MKTRIQIYFSVLILIASMMISEFSQALPAFARRENVSCVMCHTNGAAAHLTEFGYMYRRMAFHWPGKLGDLKSDDEAFNATKHMAAGVNVSYLYDAATNSNSNIVSSKVVNNNGININEVELWPLVGGFLGNWGVWSELDSVTPSNAGANVQMSLADIRWASGTPDSFINIRAGMIAPEGYGASDQWLTDSNTPLMDHLTANNNSAAVQAGGLISQGAGDTLASPWGAMGVPELGFEFGYNYKSSHVTLGLYNGYVSNYVNNDGTLAFGAAPTTNAGANAISQSVAAYDNGMRDFRFQYDQFLGTFGALTLGYYSGAIPLVDPSMISFSWDDHYTQERAYLTIYAIPEKLDVFLGGGWSENQYVSTTTVPDGKFESKGGFLGLMYYATPHLVVAARGDKFYYNSNDSATGYSLQASLPYDNIIWNFHFNSTASSIPSVTGGYVAGQNNNVGITLRFLL